MSAISELEMHAQVLAVIGDRCVRSRALRSSGLECVVRNREGLNDLISEIIELPCVIAAYKPYEDEVEDVTMYIYFCTKIKCEARQYMERNRDKLEYIRQRMGFCEDDSLIDIALEIVEKHPGCHKQHKREQSRPVLK